MPQVVRTPGQWRVGYAALRFLLPAYALLAIPVADALAHLMTAPSRRWRPVVVGLTAVGLAGHLAVQCAVLEATVFRNTAARQDWARDVADLHRLGVRPPCLLTGYDDVPIAFTPAARRPTPADTTPTPPHNPYLAASSAAVLLPTPGGLGSLDATLAWALTAAGAPGSAGVSAVLGYRLLTVWIPLVPGLLVLAVMVRRKAL